VRGFVLQDRGSPSQVKTHGEVPIITKIFDDSGEFDYTVKNRFSDLTKVQVGWE